MDPLRSLQGHRAYRTAQVFPEQGPVSLLVSVVTPILSVEDFEFGREVQETTIHKVSERAGSSPCQIQQERVWQWVFRDKLFEGSDERNTTKIRSTHHSFYRPSPFRILESRTNRYTVRKSGTPMLQVNLSNLFYLNPCLFPLESPSGSLSSFTLRDS